MKNNRLQENDRDDEAGAMMDALYIEAVHEVLSDVDSLGESSVSKSENKFEINIHAPNGVVTFKIDTGADVSVIGDDQLKEFGLQPCNLNKTKETDGSG